MAVVPQRWKPIWEKNGFAGSAASPVPAFVSLMQAPVLNSDMHERLA